MFWAHRWRGTKRLHAVLLFVARRPNDVTRSPDYGDSCRRRPSRDAQVSNSSSPSRSGSRPNAWAQSKRHNFGLSFDRGGARISLPVGLKVRISVFVSVMVSVSSRLTSLLNRAQLNTSTDPALIGHCVVVVTTNRTRTRPNGRDRDR